MKMRSIVLSLVLLSAIAVAAAAQAGKTALNVKLGLWEVTTQTQMSGVPPIEPSDKMTPEQKARFDAAMKASAAEAAKPHTMRTCLTREKLDKSLFQNEKDNCKQTMITNTATVNAFKFECSGQPATTGDFKFEALTPENVKGTGTFTMTGPTKMSSTMTMTAKWVGASCGDVK